MSFSIERNDLAHMNVDAIVVPANEKLRITGGTGAAVAKVAGSLNDFIFAERAQYGG